MKKTIKVPIIPLLFLCVGLLLGGCFTGAVHGSYIPESSAQTQRTLPHYIWVSKNGTVSNKSQRDESLTVLCPNGYVVLGGGGHAPYFSGSYPNAGRTGWTVLSSVPWASPAPATVYASCTPK